jgi:hypothetical protein
MILQKNFSKLDNEKAQTIISSTKQYNKMDLQKSSWAKKLTIITCFALVFFFVILENSCIFGGLSRRIIYHKIKFAPGHSELFYRSTSEIKVKEIPLNESSTLDRKITKVQLVPLWTNNDSMKV